MPAANAGNSNTPTGPFQNTVFASASFAANRARVAGPMSRHSRSAGNAPAGDDLVLGVGGEPVAATRSTGSTTSTPRLAASSSTSDTLRDLSASSSDWPTSCPCAARNV